MNFHKIVLAAGSSGGLGVIGRGDARSAVKILLWAGEDNLPPLRKEGR